MANNNLDAPRARDVAKIGLALGGGGARGLAHIAILEAFDELGVKPDMIAGSSMGAIVAVAYASGLKAHDIRSYALDVLRTRAEIAKRLFSGKRSDFLKLLDVNLRAPALIDGARLLDLFMPPGVADTFEQLKLKVLVVATDYYARSEKIFEHGALRPAVAASIALPGFLTPRIADDRLLIDGAIVNPLPFDRLSGHVDVTVAVDVTGGPVGNGSQIPNNVDLLFRTTQIMQHQIVAAKLQAMPVDILIQPDVDQFRVLDFHKVRAIFAAAEPAKEDMKRALEKVLERGGPA